MEFRICGYKLYSFATHNPHTVIILAFLQICAHLHEIPGFGNFNFGKMEGNNGCRIKSLLEKNVNIHNFQLYPMVTPGPIRQLLITNYAKLPNSTWIQESMTSDFINISSCKAKVTSFTTWSACVYVLMAYLICKREAVPFVWAMTCHLAKVKVLKVSNFM